MRSDVATEKPLISAILPTHNRAELLQEALASVYAQEGAGERFEMEVIVVDDASSDHTAEVVRRFPGVRYIRLETNRGPQVARNTGIRASRGKYVSFLDDDDLWMPYKLFLLLGVLESHPEAGVAYGQSVTRFGDRTYVAPGARAPSGWLFRKSLRDLRGFVGMHISLIRREAFEKAGYFDEKLCMYHDFEMELRLEFHYRFQFVPIPVAVYRRSLQGRYKSHVFQGRHIEALKRVVETALALLPADEKDAVSLRNQVHAHMHLRIARSFGSIREYERMQAYLATALKDHPWMATQEWVRSEIVRLALRSALASESAVDTARTFSQQVRESARSFAFGERLGVQRLLADLWWRAAYEAMRNGRRQSGGTAAALKSALHHPHMLGLGAFDILARKVRMAAHRKESH